jgi:hypothetical protein
MLQTTKKRLTPHARESKVDPVGMLVGANTTTLQIGSRNSPAKLT